NKWVWLVAGMLFVLLIVGFVRIRTQLLHHQKLYLEKEVIGRTLQLAAKNEEIEKKNTQLGQTIQNLRNAQSQLVESEKMASLGILTAGIAHEINNPVNYLKGGVFALEKCIDDLLTIESQTHEAWELAVNGLRKKKIIDQTGLLDKLDGKLSELRNKLDYNLVIQEYKDLLLTIKSGAERTSDIVKGLRNFSRMDENNFQKTNIVDAIQSSLILLSSKYKGRVQIYQQIDKIPLIEYMPGKMSQVFLNLLDNALHATPDGGSITIAIKMEGTEKIKISIADTGTGIPESARKNIFDPFFTTKDVGVGTGLGLSISKGILDDHHADIWFETSDKGTVFFIVMPVEQTIDTR
ncbi:MAG: ATP-binding protein, partial [Cyclobacteriaceae bacterium]|nr:ATP-binding protein [Cyclobacteriaceae bacterium]